MTATLQRDDVAVLVADTVAELGEGWHVEPTDYVDSRHVIGGPGASSLMVDQLTPTVVEVWGLFPREAHNVMRLPTCRINVTAGRGPAVLAREIRRRLLPGYLPVLEDAHQRLAARDADTARRHELRDQLVTVLPGSTVIAHGESDWRSQIALEIPGPVWGRLDITSTCALELRGLDVATTRRLLAVLAGEDTP